jgi:type I restriction enzyme R subunit
MSLHKEINFENDVCTHLGANGWLYEDGDAQRYDRPRAMYTPDVLAWLQTTQPQAWETLQKNNGAAATDVLLDRLRKQLDERGTLDVLRHGIELMGLRQALSLAQFKPALAINPEIQNRYAANRLRVVRQLRYSVHNENCIDLVLFLNGLPVATVELKTDFTQSIDDACDQYRFDRQPKPKGQGTLEPLLSFPNGALVHFAVSNSEVRMTTRLAGAATQFLPFNRGDDGAAGNPANPTGHKTAYLWQEVWDVASWLEVLGRYLVAERDAKKQITKLIFPRYHQLDATRKLLATVLNEGAGHKYLIQHSAGSGKTNSIAWTAHFLADLHDAQNRKVFDSVLVISDRTVLDAQLQEAIFGFERTTGVVASIKGESQSKSGELAQALSGGKKIVVCTIQTFPFAMKAVHELAATQGKRFAVIADEAHSSQTGEAAAKLKAVLSVEEIAALNDGGEVSTEDLLAAQMGNRAAEAGITYVAFTATPKAKTLELFGRRPLPALPAGPGNLPGPFHVYSMRQAIEEGFILDVLQNYTPYKTAFKLTHNGAEYDETEVERGAAVKGIMRWVRLHPYNISQKVQVVVGSRVEAVRWQIAVNKYIREKNYKVKTLVAFSGEVMDIDSLPEPVTEASKQLNPGLKGTGIREAFATDEYQLLLVANKFQTGFDQPLLCGMYIDKRLAGIAAVQTLSRLNRAYRDDKSNKDTTYVVDFVNEPEDILAAFKDYHTTAELANVTDPNLVYDLRAKLDGAGHYDDFEVNRVVAVLMSATPNQGALVAAASPVADRVVKRFKAAQQMLLAAQDKKDTAAERTAKDDMDALDLFKHDLGTFCRAYAFLSQMFNYGNTDIEKRAMFYKLLLPLLEFKRERDGVDLSKLALSHHTVRNLGKQALDLNEGLATKLVAMEPGGGTVQEKEKALLAEIIGKVNDLFEGDLTDDDQLVYVNNVIKGKLLESEVLTQQASNNTKEQFSNSPDINHELINAFMDSQAAHIVMSQQALNSERVRDGIKRILLENCHLYEALRMRGGAGGLVGAPAANAPIG